MDEIKKVETPIQLKHNAQHLVRSIVLLQIAIAINVLSILIFNLIRHFSIYFPESDSLFKVLGFSISVDLLISLVPYFLILVCLWRIISLFKAEIHLFYSISAIVVFLFCFYLKASNLWHHILINSGGGYTESDWPVIGRLILPPLGIVSCYVIGIRLNLHFSTFMNQKKMLQWLIYSFAVIWFLRIALAFGLWLQNSDTIEFSLRYLVFYNRRWQIESAFYWQFFRYSTIALLLWQVWLFIYLRFVNLKFRNSLKGKREQSPAAVSI